MTNLEVIQTWILRVWKEQDAQAIDEMFIPEGRAEGLGEKRIGPDEFKAFHQQLLSLIDDVHVKILRYFQEGTWSSVLCKMECTNRKDPSQKLQIDGSAFARIENGKIVEAYNHFDFMSLFEQLGLLPEGIFGKCLSGEKLCE